MMPESGKHIVIRDSTLREGLDVPRVSFSIEQRTHIAKLLNEAGVSEIEIVAPGKVDADLGFARTLKDLQLEIKATGLIYANNPAVSDQIHAAAKCLDWIDLIMPVSPLRKPYDYATKSSVLTRALKIAAETMQGFGAGFPNATQTDSTILLELATEAIANGAGRITIYDTNGNANPFSVFELIKKLRPNINVPLFFHGHNDLGMATANTMAAIKAGADGIDATVNGLGDRAGNCSLEQMALLLELEGYHTGITLPLLKTLSRVVATESGIEVSPLTPVVGDYIFSHKSPGHLEVPGLFEAYDPGIVGAERELLDTE